MFYFSFLPGVPLLTTIPYAISVSNVMVSVVTGDPQSYLDKKLLVMPIRPHGKKSASGSWCRKNLLYNYVIANGRRQIGFLLFDVALELNWHLLHTLLEETDTNCWPALAK